MSNDKMRAAFEAKWPVPQNCIWTGHSYAVEKYNAWDAAGYCDRWDGWQAASAVQAAEIARLTAELTLAKVTPLVASIRGSDLSEFLDEFFTAGRNEWMHSEDAIVAFIDAHCAAQVAQALVAWIEHHKAGDNLNWIQCGPDDSPLYTSAQPAIKIGVRPDGSQGGDDWHVEQFALAMSKKMALSRAKGRSGWDNPDECSMNDLAEMLCRHVLKGDPVDIGNFSMMLHQRDPEGEESYSAITAAASNILIGHPQPSADDARDAARYRWLRECNSGSHVIVELRGNDDEIVLTEDVADAAIDAAMKGAK